MHQLTQYIEAVDGRGQPVFSNYITKLYVDGSRHVFAPKQMFEYEIMKMLDVAEICSNIFGAGNFLMYSEKNSTCEKNIEATNLIGIEIFGTALIIPMYCISTERTYA